MNHWDIIERFSSPSTRVWAAEARKKNAGFFEFVHGYIYTRWPYFYIRTAIGKHWFALLAYPLYAIWGLMHRIWLRMTGGDPQQLLNFADRYHGKAMPLGKARKLIKVNRDICVDDLEQVVPYPTARTLILENAGHVAVLDCPCRMALKDHCEPVDVCLIVGEPFVGFVLEHHPTRSRRITDEEALDILEQENKRGHVAHAFFKDAMLGRFYAICNCCSCCCGAMKAMRNDIPMLAPSGYGAIVDAEACVGCGKCAAICPFGAITVDPKQTAVIGDGCMGCGVCMHACPKEALSLELDPSKGLPLDVDTLVS
jgi:ferredoxin